MDQKNKRKLSEQEFFESFKKTKIDPETAASLRQYLEDFIFVYGVNSLDLIPVETFGEIFAYVGNLAAISRVCKKWRQICKYLPLGRNLMKNPKTAYLFTLLQYLSKSLITEFEFSIAYPGIGPLYVYVTREENIRIHFDCVSTWHSKGIHMPLHESGWKPLREGTDHFWETKWETTMSGFATAIGWLKNYVDLEATGHYIYMYSDPEYLEIIKKIPGEDHFWKMFRRDIDEYNNGGAIGNYDAMLARIGDGEDECIRIVPNECISENPLELSLFARSFWNSE